MNGTSPSDSSISYLEYSFWGGGSYPSAEMQSVYSTASADGVNSTRKNKYIQHFNGKYPRLSSKEMGTTTQVQILDEADCISHSIAQSARAVEYTDCTSAEG